MRYIVNAHPILEGSNRASLMLHVRIDDALIADGTTKLANAGLTVSDAVRILLTRISKVGGMPLGLIADPTAYDTWFNAKVQQALSDTAATLPHTNVMDDVQALIDSKRRAKA